MATYNGGAFVAETIDSVLAQSFTDFELLIIDDKSTDDTLAVLATYDDPRIRILPSPVNQGPVVTRNIGFANARGRYIAALDQDDLCHPERFAVQVAYLDTHPDVVLVGTAAALLQDGAVTPSRLPPETTPGFIDWLMLVGNPLVWSSVMFRTETARSFDPVTRPDWLYVEDFDLYHRLRQRGRIARIDEPLTLYRCHAGGASQRYHAIMKANATRVLAGVYATIFGADADEYARLVAEHIMDGAPVPDVATLRKLFGVIGQLRHHFMRENAVDAATLGLIEHHQARLWRQAARAAMRARAVSLAEATGARPRYVRLSDSDRADLLLSPLVGRVRSIGRAMGKRG